jgi:hypothetical protein
MTVLDRPLAISVTRYATLLLVTRVMGPTLICLAGVGLAPCPGRDLRRGRPAPPSRGRATAARRSPRATRPSRLSSRPAIGVRACHTRPAQHLGSGHGAARHLRPGGFGDAGPATAGDSSPDTPSRELSLHRHPKPTHSLRRVGRRRSRPARQRGRGGLPGSPLATGPARRESRACLSQRPRRRVHRASGVGAPRRPRPTSTSTTSSPAAAPDSGGLAGGVGRRVAAPSRLSW